MLVVADDAVICADLQQVLADGLVDLAPDLISIASLRAISSASTSFLLTQLFPTDHTCWGLIDVLPSRA